MTNGYAEPVLRWYAAHARDLPWRQPDASAWSVLVSEIMLQQTPVARVLPAHAAWLERWPTPPSLAAAAPGDAVRQWGRLGYPRRAVRLHATAKVLTEDHDGQVPDSVEALRALPGVGSYTAAAVASFAFGQRHAVLDTNVRRVLARLLGGEDLPPRSTIRRGGTAGRVAAPRARRGGRRGGRSRSWSSARWSAPRPGPTVTAARWRGSARGAARAARPPPCARRRSATRAPTGSAAAACSRC